jgi:hypothetical protein
VASPKREGEEKRVRAEAEARSEKAGERNMDKRMLVEERRGGL